MVLAVLQSNYKAIIFTTPKKRNSGEIAQQREPEIASRLRNEWQEGGGRRWGGSVELPGPVVLRGPGGLQYIVLYFNEISIFSKNAPGVRDSILRKFKELVGAGAQLPHPFPLTLFHDSFDVKVRRRYKKIISFIFGAR